MEMVVRMGWLSHWVWEGASEICTPVVARVFDGGAYGHC